MKKDFECAQFFRHVPDVRNIYQQEETQDEGKIITRTYR